MEKQRMLEQEAQFHASKQKQEPLINLLKSMVCLFQKQQNQKQTKVFNEYFRLQPKIHWLNQ